MKDSIENDPKFLLFVEYDRWISRDDVLLNKLVSRILEDQRMDPEEKIFMAFRLGIAVRDNMVTGVRLATRIRTFFQKLFSAR